LNERNENERNKQMKNIKTAAYLLIASLVLAVLGLFASAVRETGETVQQFAPIPRATADIALDRRQQEAQVTATYIAVLESEIVSDTMTTHRLQRESEQERHELDRALAETLTTVKQIAVWAVGFAVWAACVGLGVKLGAMWAASGIKAARESMMPLPPLSRPLADGVHLLSNGRATDTRSLASWSVVADIQPTSEQAEALAMIRRALYGDIVRALVPLLGSGQSRETVEVQRELRG